MTWPRWRTWAGRRGRATVVLLTLLVSVNVGRHFDDRPLPSLATTRPAPSVAAPDLMAERAAFHTRLRRLGPPPGPQQIYDAPFSADAVTYESDGLRLQAWASKPTTDGRRHPAVVYLHGNFNFELRHWFATLPYREAGMVAMAPMLRGENGNPSHFELFYGEVNDVLAAGRYLAARPDVDPHRVYLAGHSVGGTLVLLAAVVPGPYAAMAAISGSPDQQTFLADEGPSVRIVDVTDPTEMRLRSAMPFVAGLTCPPFVLDGSRESWAIPQTRAFVRAARGAGKACQFTIIPGDHLTAKMPAIEQSVPLLLSCRKP